MLFELTYLFVIWYTYTHQVCIGVLIYSLGKRKQNNEEDDLDGGDYDPAEPLMGKYDDQA